MRVDYTNYTDTELLLALPARSNAVLNEIIERYWESLFNKAYSFLRDEDLAKDCVQQVFISLWQRQERASAIERLESYLHQAVRYQALKAIRSQMAAREMEQRLARATDKIITSDLLAHKELLKLIRQLIDSLPEDQRTIFKAHREEELTYSQIAERLNISVKTVEKKMSLSLRYLRMHLSDFLVFAITFHLLP